MTEARGAVVEAVPLTQGEIEKEGPGVVEELEGARAVLLEAQLTTSQVC